MKLFTLPAAISKSPEHTASSTFSSAAHRWTSRRRFRLLGQRLPAAGLDVVDATSADPQLLACQQAALFGHQERSHRGGQ